jgi:hypothetical protein
VVTDARRGITSRICDILKENCHKNQRMLSSVPGTINSILRTYN